jgi:hypothetical protein
LASIWNSAFIRSSSTTSQGQGHEPDQHHPPPETLETRKSDRLDFHDTAVWCIRDALEAAFKAGAELGASMPKATESGIAKD